MFVKDLNVLAVLVFNLWYFFRKGCKPDENLYCRAQAKVLRACDMFFKAGNYILVKPDSLPLDPNFKALGINVNHRKKKSRLYFETTLIDWKRVAEKMVEEKMESKGIELRGRRFFWKDQPVVTTSSRHHFGNVTSPRTVFYTNNPLEDSPIEPLVHIAEMVWNCNCFVDAAIPRLKTVTWEQTAILGHMEMQQVQEMRQEMLQLITQEQKPLMIIQLRQCAVRAHRSEILAMNNVQLARHIRRFARENPFVRVG